MDKVKLGYTSVEIHRALTHFVDKEALPSIVQISRYANARGLSEPPAESKKARHIPEGHLRYLLEGMEIPVRDNDLLRVLEEVNPSQV